MDSVVSGSWSVVCLPPQLPSLQRGVSSSRFSLLTSAWCCRPQAELAEQRMVRVCRREPVLAPEGSRTAVERLAKVNQTPGEWEAWMHEARLEAILGCCRSSIKSVTSGVRCYVAFMSVSLIVACSVVMCSCCVGCRCWWQDCWQALSTRH